MAIEDHPKFPEWADALDRLKEAKDALQTAVAFGEGPIVVERLRGNVIAAQLHFHKVSDEIDV